MTTRPRPAAVPSPVPLVSIGLPVRNGGRFLAQTLDDLLGQSFEDFELVVCDNASNDETEGIVRAAAARDGRVRYCRNARNLGALPNANCAFRRSRGRYYTLAAHDDRHAPDFLEKLVAALEARPDAVLAYGRKGLVDDDGRPFTRDVATGHHRAAGHVVDYDGALERPLPADPVARYRAVLRSNDPNAAMHGLFRREVLARLPSHDFHGSDRLIVAAAALHGPFAFVDEELFGYRIHADSTRYLDRAAWVTRESGRAAGCSALDHALTLARYLGTAAAAPLTAGQRLRAWATTLGSVARPAVLQALFLPGLHSYWGWRRWPWQVRNAERGVRNAAGPGTGAERGAPQVPAPGRNEGRGLAARTSKVTPHSALLTPHS